jgi:hypothetical protein
VQFIAHSSRGCEAPLDHGIARVTFPSVLALCPLLLGFAAVSSAPPKAVTRLVQDDELVLRVPVRPLPQPRIVWQPGQQLKCVPIRAIRGAMLSSPENVDILFARQQRVRAHFAEDCPALDFYDGFYLKPKDGRLCAGRDIVYSRMGGSCRIEGFRQLVPRLRRTTP